MSEQELSRDGRTDNGIPPPAPLSTSSDNASVSTTASTIPRTAEHARPTTLPKPSGLKPPSKIGRLCSNAAPKPAVPISPRADVSSTDTPRKSSDDYSRKHLSAASSSFSGTSMDALWEKHPRRLSEAGLRRSSDHSVVLTEDTDSFIIGERVWVGGTKPGQIAYIGETQFAPGDWAGIVLDDPIGKNDGSVAGVRYFQCPEKRGVFSRLTRLTRAPLVSHAPHDTSPLSDAGSVFERPPSGAARPRRTLSPNGSVRSIVSSKMNASISTTANGELRLGDRVIVSSSRGSKAGILRYVGVTDFASGVWGGVELDDPLGKNDGSVDGKRYFECAPRFGLFAPISKVSKSPSNRKPGTCAIHSNGRGTPLRRSNSRESLTSLGTSVASSRVGVRLGVTSLGAQRVGPRASSTPVSAKNALQELLREKQHHLERLMRERELERAEIAKVSLQAERAETALELIKKEATQASTENAKLKIELDKLNKMLEDEKQKVEDLMFRNEEENINREDYNRYKDAMEQEKAAREKHIRELEAEIALQSARADTTAAALKALEDQRTIEVASVAEQHKEELSAAHTLSSELQKLLDEAYALLKEKENEKDSLGKSMSEELTRVKAEYEKALNEAKTKIAIAQTEFETQVSVLTAKLQLAESKLDAEKQNIERLNKENSQTVIDLNTRITQLQAVLDDKTLELNKVLGMSKEHEVSLNKEITKLKMELSAKILDLEQLEDSKKKQDTVCKSLQEELSRIKEDLTNKENEYKTFLNEISQQNEKNKAEIIKLQQNLQSKTKDYERLLSESSESSNSNEKMITEYKETLHERDKEIIKLKDEFEQATANFNIKHSKIAEEHKKEIDDRNSKIEQLMKEIESHKLALDQSKIELDTLNSQFTLNVDELKALKLENERLKQSIDELTHVNTNLKEKMAAMELEIGELKRQLNSSLEKCEELQVTKEKIENEYMNLTGQTTDSNEQFNKLSQHLKDTEKELQELRDKHREVTNNYGRVEQELKQKLFKLQEDFSVERGQLLDTINENIEKQKVEENKIKEFEMHAHELSNRTKELENQNDSLLDENSILKREIEGLRAKEQELSIEYDSIRKKLEMEIDRYKEEVSMLKAEGATSEVKLMEKVDQLTEAQNDLNNKLEEARKHEDSLQKVLDDMTAQMNNRTAQHEKQIVHIQDQLSTVNEELNKYKAEEQRLKDLLEEKQNYVKELTLKLEMFEVDVKSHLELVSEKDRQLASVNEELSKVTDSKQKLEEQYNNLTAEALAIKQKYDNLVSNATAEESMLKDQLDQMETLKKDLLTISNEKTLLESKYNEATNELQEVKVKLEEAEKVIKENTNITDNLSKEMGQKDDLLKSHIDQITEDAEKIKKLEEEIAEIRLKITNKDKALEEHQIELTKLKDTLKSESNETQNNFNTLQTENEQIKEKHKMEVESLTNETKTLRGQIVEKEKQLENLQKTQDKITELQELLAKSESDIKQLTNINEGQKLNYEDLNKQLQTQFDEYKKESRSKRHDLKNQLNDFEKQLHESREKLKEELEKQNQLQIKLTDAEKRILELSEKLELLTVQQTSDVNKDDRLEKLTIELQAIRKSSAESMAKSELTINNLQIEVDNKIKDLKQKDEMINKLQEELKNHKVKAEVAEREKAMIQKEMSTMGKNVRDKNDNDAMGTLGQGDNATTKVQEEKEIIDGQVSFLNSVIVDMQRKNEQLMARVQALEGATTPSEPPLFNGRKTRTPRLFCDICDVFDAHDTEDCARQAATPPPPARTPPPPRPYCDICEVFGHATENCDEEETF
ncbi:PREDICTED: CAP-Gly domain-containing linker protein 2 isoform X4 [Papilio xuthus]|uniref:CAP-Gly domain-containing linker protein 2 isoform X4 n=1 Tax=Papilio xuthus TaxID=66420 RepID=A0AAJ6ZWC5_PAPXU|nr:PREDICTED: CAP-Gly domain-containing linker protein 2 isoform X4 [Papilio xuthus]